ncbi:multicopper oxidase family protein [Acidobacteria bacterium AB60]|nr:multicopper oxidase family protein [Acidobacteria bacterium AB60]
MTMKNLICKASLLLAAVAPMAVAPTARAAAPGITGPVFNLTAQSAYITQPDGQAVYSWGYGCNAAPAGFAPKPKGLDLANANCNTMQIPGPTLIVTEGDTVTVNLTNNLPTSVGNTSILFPGFNVSVNGGVTGLLTSEAAPNGGTVQYSFVAKTPGTRAYYSGTQGDLQVEMGLYGAVIVLPKTPPAQCTAGLPTTNPGANAAAQANWGESDFRLASAAYDDPHTCYDREYLFQFSEMDPRIHIEAEKQVAACAAAGAPSPCNLQVPTEPYHPAYFMINGRSMPDDMDANYAPQYPHQPYNGNPHMHPGEMVLLRIIGQGRWQHPFHEHANHVRILARDGNLILSPNGNLAGPALFTTTTTPGMAMDGIFYYTGRGLNWDMYGHSPTSADGNATLPCDADANGYNTKHPAAINYFEWCQDHNKPLEAAPTGDVAGNGPVTLPNPNILTNGAWYGGSAYLGPDATKRATGCMPSGTPQSNSPNCASAGVTPPSGTIANSPGGESGFAFMWHSHNEREITTNNIFPGGMMMMMLVDSREFVIDESN